MNSRKYVNDPASLLKEGKEIMLEHDDTRFYFRVFSVNFVLNGMSAANVAEIAGVSRSTVSDWVKTVDEKGFEALIVSDKIISTIKNIKSAVAH